MLDFYFIFLRQIIHLQGMQLTTNSSTPSKSWLAWGWDRWIQKVESFRLICCTIYNVICSWFCHWFKNRNDISPILGTHVFLRFFVRGKEKPPPRNGKTQLTYVGLAAECGKSDFDAVFCSRWHLVSFLHDICRFLSPQYLTPRQKF